MMAQTGAGLWNALDRACQQVPSGHDGSFQKKYLVSLADVERLVEQYKSRLTENSRLIQAARLAAKQHVLLTSYLLPPPTGCS